MKFAKVDEIIIYYSNYKTLASPVQPIRLPRAPKTKLLPQDEVLVERVT
jgi:hypothetical protein